MSSKSVLVVAVLAVLAAGCGGEGEKKAGSPGVAPTSTPASADPADVAIAEASVLQLSDFPSGWEGKAKEDDDDDDDGTKARLAKCVGVDYEDLYSDGRASVDSRVFVSEDDDEIENTVAVAKDEQEAKDVFAIVASDKYRQCALEEVKKSVKQSIEDSEDDYELGDVTLNEISFDSFGDESTAFRISAAVESEGISVDVNIDYVIVRVGRAATTVNAQATFSPFDSDELSGFVKTSTDRLSEQLQAAAG